MKLNITAIFFDIGGTLRITEQEKDRDQNKIKEIIDILGLHTSIDEFITRITKGEKAYRRKYKPSYIELDEKGLWAQYILPEYPQEFVYKHAIRFNQLWRESSSKQILPDMEATLRTLSSRGYKLGLISNTTSTVEGFQILEEKGLTDLFSTVILSAKFGRRKPHPSIFLAAAREAGVHPSQCAYIGDRPSRDLIGARQSGYGKVVIINADGHAMDGYDPDDYDPDKDSDLILKPDHFVRSLSQLLNFFPEIDSNHRESNAINREPIKVYDAAFSTMWGIDQEMPFLDSFTALKKLGIYRFELNHKVTTDLLDQFVNSDNYACSVHDPCPAELFYDEMKRSDILLSSLDETRRSKCVDMVKGTIDLAEKLGSKNVILHTGTIQCDRSRDRQLRKMFENGLKGTAEYNDFLEETKAHRKQVATPFVDQVLKSLQEIVGHARDSGVAIGLENRYRFYDIPLPDEMALLLDVCRENWYGFHYDTGHAFTLDNLGLVKQSDWLEQFAQRMIGIHIHDVIGITDHQVPGMGEIDFRWLASFIPANTMKTLEIGSQASLPEIANSLEVLVEAGCIMRL